MAVKRLAAAGAIPRFLGFSADVKPTDSLPGAEFIETDTGSVYRWDGSSWLPATTEVKTGAQEFVHQQLLIIAIRELRALRMLAAIQQGQFPVLEPLPEIVLNG